MYNLFVRYEVVIPELLEARKPFPTRLTRADVVPVRATTLRAVLRADTPRIVVLPETVRDTTERFDDGTFFTVPFAERTLTLRVLTLRELVPRSAPDTALPDTARLAVFREAVVRATVPRDIAVARVVAFVRTEFVRGAVGVTGATGSPYAFISENTDHISKPLTNKTTVPTAFL